MGAYYNEFDPHAAAWLRELIRQGHIADGVVDERSIEDVIPGDLAGFHQCHFFAGIGVWSHALRSAGWPDDRPIWTGSCPCQPFSSAGKGAGFADERHLWPAFHWLIEQCRPAVVAGEQVADKSVNAWIDLVSLDLEALGYRVGAVAFPSASVGAPHIRDRTYWLADAYGEQVDAPNSRRLHPKSCGTGSLGELANTHDEFQGATGDRSGRGDLGRYGELGRLADAAGAGREGFLEERGFPRIVQPECHGSVGEGAGPESGAGPVSGFWRDADWLFCRDERWRPVEPGTFPLADGAPARVVRLRGYGNAVNAAAATAFIEAYLEEGVAA